MHLAIMKGRGFTLVEMTIVILIMFLVIASLLPAMAIMQRQSDLYATNNAINVVHKVQRSNAMQFGYAGAVYGYTIRSDNSIAPGITPWVINGGTVTTMTNIEMGHRFPRNSGGSIDITDNLRVVRFDAPKRMNPTASAARLWDGTSNRDLCIGFVPRAGFATAAYNAAVGADPPLTLGVIGTESDAVFRLRTNRTGFRDYFIVQVSKLGIISIYAP